MLARFLLSAFIALVIGQAAYGQDSGNAGGPSSGFYNGPTAQAPNNGNYITTGGLNPVLTNERQIAGSGGVTITDGGAKGSLTIGLTNSLANGLTGGTTAQTALNSVAGASTKGDILYYDGANWLHLGIGGASTFLGISAGVPSWTALSNPGAPIGSAYITVGSDASLAAERAITPGTGILGTDGGANSTYTISIDTATVLTQTNTMSGITNKTFTAPAFAWNSGSGVTLNGSLRTVALKWTDPSVGSLGTITFPDTANTAQNVVLDNITQTLAGTYTFSNAPKLSSNTLLTSTGNTLTFTNATDTVDCATNSLTLTNKTLTTPQITNAGSITFLQTSGNYVLSAAANNPAATRTYSFYDAGGAGDIAIKSGTPTAGAVAYADGNKILFTSAGTSGQLLQSNGSSAPSWTSSTLPLGDTGISAKAVGWVFNQSLDSPASAFSAVGLNVVNYTAGTNTNGSGANGHVVNVVTTTSSGNAAGFQTNSTVTQYQMQPILAVRMVTNSSIATQRIWIGFTPSDESATSAPVNVSMAAFRYDTGAGDTTWRCYTDDGGATATNTDSGVTVTTSTKYDLVIDCSTSGHVKFYINGSLVSDQTTHLPVNSTSLEIEESITTLTTAATQMGLGTTRFETY